MNGRWPCRTVVRTVELAAFRAITGNGVNVLAMGAFYVTPELGKQCADAFLYNDFGR
ncbi:MAG: hypothetical protein ACI4RD_05220 [Kiritimatiellia bacterium]